MALPFRLSTTPYIFTKILRFVINLLRCKDHQSVDHLDNFLLLESSNEECKANVRTFVNLLQSLSFRINFAKFH